MYIIIIFKSLLLPNPLADQSQIFKETSVYEGGTSVYMSKMATMAIYGKNPSKIFFGTDEPIAMKLGIHMY